MNALAITDSAVLTDDSGLVRRFLTWIARAAAPERAAAVNALARAYLYCHADPGNPRRSGNRADPHARRCRPARPPRPCARRSRAPPRRRGISCWRWPATSPRCASGAGAVAAAARRRSRRLRRHGDAVAQTAIARRARLAAPVAAALAEIGEAAAALALIGNLGADLRAPALWRLFERFGGDAAFARPVDRKAGDTGLVARGHRGGDHGRRLELCRRLARPAPRRAHRPRRPRAGLRRHSSRLRRGGPRRADDWLRAASNLTVGLLMRALAAATSRCLRKASRKCRACRPRASPGCCATPHGQGFASLYARAKHAGAAAAGVPHRRSLRFAGRRRGRGRRLRADDADIARHRGQGRSGARPRPGDAVAARRRGGAGGRARIRRGRTRPRCSPTPEIEAEIEPPMLRLNVEPGNENFAPPVTLDLFPEPVAVAA